MKPSIQPDITCKCLVAGPHRAEASTRRLGVDDTAGRYADVEVWRCLSCQRRWLHYRLRNIVAERYLIGLLPEHVVPLSAAAAESLLNASSPVFAWGVWGTWYDSSYHAPVARRRVRGPMALGFRDW